jgi:hypothetical protein
MSDIEDISTGTLVSAHLPDRMGTVIIGALMPYDASQGERVRDGAGGVWNVISESVRPIPDYDDV